MHRHADRAGPGPDRGALPLGRPAPGLLPAGPSALRGGLAARHLCGPCTGEGCSTTPPCVSTSGRAAGSADRLGGAGPGAEPWTARACTLCHSPGPATGRARARAARWRGSATAPTGRICRSWSSRAACSAPLGADGCCCTTATPPKATRARRSCCGRRRLPDHRAADVGHEHPQRRGAGGDRGRAGARAAGGSVGRALSVSSRCTWSGTSSGPRRPACGCLLPPCRRSACRRPSSCRPSGSRS